MTAVRIDDPATSEEFRARVWRTHHGTAVFGVRAVHAPERSEQRGRGFGGAVVAVVEKADQRREADRIGEQNPFVVGVVRGFADAIKEVDAVFPFLLCELDLTREGMQMGNQTGHDLSKPRIFLRHGLQHGGRYVFSATENRVVRLPVYGISQPRTVQFLLAIACASNLRHEAQRQTGEDSEALLKGAGFSSHFWPKKPSFPFVTSSNFANLGVRKTPAQTW